MKPATFEYTCPSGLEEALTLRKEWGDESRPLAGGQSLIPLLRFRLAHFRWLIDLGRVAELDGIETASDGSLTIGAMTQQRTAERDPRVGERCPLLSEALSLIGCAQIRNRGTVGGSVAHADPTAELPAALTALDATFDVANVSGGRSLSAEEMFVSYFETAVRDDELLKSIRVPARRGHGRLGDPGALAAPR